MKLNLDFSLYKGKTRLKHWWPKVKEHFTQVQTAHNALEDTAAAEKTRLDTEITQRTNADIALSDRINAEKSARESADTELQDNINAEIKERTEDDNALDYEIREEIENRENADNLIRESIKNEAKLRESADVNFKEEIRVINNNINALKERRRVNFGDVIYDARVDLDWSYPANPWDISKYGYLLVGDQVTFTLKEIILEDGTQQEEISFLSIYMPYNSHYLQIRNNGGFRNSEPFQVGHTYTAVVTKELNHSESVILSDGEAMIIVDNGDSKSPYDLRLDSNSDRPVQNRVIKKAFDDMTSRIDNISSGIQGSVEPNDMTPTFTQASSRTNIVSGEKLSVIFGKIKKWFADLRPIAFSGSYGDLEDVPYASCSTPATTAIKEVSINNFKLITGAVVRIRFIYRNQTGQINAKLNVNNTGAKDIALFVRGDYADVLSDTTWSEGETVEFIYNGVSWVAISSNAGFVQPSYNDLSTVALTNDYNDLTNKPTIPQAVTVDSALSSSSTNPVQNKIVNAKIEELQEDLDNKVDISDLNSYGNRIAGPSELVNYAADSSRSSTIVIAASDSKIYTIVSSAYRQCIGTNDQDIINQAIATLPVNGGKIVLLEGTYNISGSIIVNKDNVTIEGMGTSTILKRMGTNFDIIRINQKKNCTIKNICIDGNRENYVGSGGMYDGQHGIGIENSQCCIITNVYIHDEYTGMAEWGGCYETTFKDNIIKDCSAWGIGLYLSQDSQTVGNYIDTVDVGIGMNWYCRRCMINNNHITSPITAGVHTTESIINSIFDGNIINKDSDTQYTIYIAGTYNIITNNQLPNMPYTDASGGSTNTYDNNI